MAYFLTGLSYPTFEVGHSLKAQEVVYKEAHRFFLFLWNHPSSETHTVCLAQWPLSAGWVPPAAGQRMLQSSACAEHSPPADLLVVSWGLWPCTTVCCFSCNIFSLIFSIWPTMTYKDRHKPGFELWGGWCWNASKSHSRTCGPGSCLCILDTRKFFSSWFAEHLVTSKTWAIQLLSVLKGFINSFSECHWILAFSSQLRWYWRFLSKNITRVMRAFHIQLLSF